MITQGKNGAIVTTVTTYFCRTTLIIYELKHKKAGEGFKYWKTVYSKLGDDKLKEQIFLYTFSDKGID